MTCIAGGDGGRGGSEAPDDARPRFLRWRPDPRRRSDGLSKGGGGAGVESRTDAEAGGAVDAGVGGATGAGVEGDDVVD